MSRAKPILEDNHYCFVCGDKNPLGFHLKFDHPEKGLLKARLIFKPEHQGYKNIVHGGLVGAVLDEMMVNLTWIEKTPSVTGEMTLRLLKPVPVGETVELEGRLERDGGRVLYLSATAKNAEGVLLASAQASCIRIRSAIQ